MKGLFPQYDDSPIQEYRTIWRTAVFVFDTNVLLNLYRYHVGTRDELLNVLDQLSERTWIPHHVALEFQRNRLKVIAEQNRRFADVRRTVQKARSSLFSDLEKLQLLKRHSLIDPQSLTSGFEKLADEFLRELDKLQAAQQKLTAPDPLKQKIESLFVGRVGKAPGGQPDVDELYKLAEARFKIKIPPGYEDAAKDRDEPDEYISGGIIYKRKYGDFLIWKQMLEHSESVRAVSIIFVTDDSKEDWWQIIESDGPKTIGPRPELIEEARASAGVEKLLMYNPEGFLKYAKEFLSAQVSEETLTEVRELSITRSTRDSAWREFRETMRRAEQAFLRWLMTRFEHAQENRRGFPSFVAEREGNTFGFDVKVLRGLQMISARVSESIYRAYYELKEGGFNEFAIVLIVGSPSEVERVKSTLSRMDRDDMPSNLRIIIGVFDYQESGEDEFHPYEEFEWSERTFNLI